MIPLTPHFLIKDDTEQFGVDWEGPVSTSTDDNTISVPETCCPLTDADVEELQVVIPPLARSTEYGIDLYERTLQFVSSKINLQ